MREHKRVHRIWCCIIILPTRANRKYFRPINTTFTYSNPTHMFVYGNHKYHHMCVLPLPSECMERSLISYTPHNIYTYACTTLAACCCVEFIWDTIIARHRNIIAVLEPSCDHDHESDHSSFGWLDAAGRLVVSISSVCQSVCSAVSNSVP